MNAFADAPHIQEGADGTRTETAFTEVDGVRWKVCYPMAKKFALQNSRVML